MTTLRPELLAEYETPEDLPPPHQAFQLATLGCTQLDLHRPPHHSAPESKNPRNCRNCANGILARNNQGSEAGDGDERTAARYLRRFPRYRAGGPLVEAARRALRRCRAAHGLRARRRQGRSLLHRVRVRARGRDRRGRRGAAAEAGGLRHRPRDPAHVHGRGQRHRRDRQLDLDALRDAHAGRPAGRGPLQRVQRLAGRVLQPRAEAPLRHLDDPPRGHRLGLQGAGAHRQARAQERDHQLRFPPRVAAVPGPALRPLLGAGAGAGPAGDAPHHHRQRGRPLRPAWVRSASTCRAAPWGC